MARIWGHGFTKTKSLQGIDNPGLYLTAYLGDMELSEALRVGNAKGQIAEAEITDAQGKRRKKAIIKGARLHLYPPGFNLYRASRGVKRPEIWQTTEVEAQALVRGAPLTYEKTISITDEAGAVKNIINYRQYNSASKEGGQLDTAQEALPSKKIPDYELEAIARCLLPDMQSYFESDEGKRAFAEWQAQQQKQGDNSK